MNRKFSKQHLKCPSPVMLYFPNHNFEHFIKLTTLKTVKTKSFFTLQTGSTDNCNKNMIRISLTWKQLFNYCYRNMRVGGANFRSNRYNCLQFLVLHAEDKTWNWKQLEPSKLPENLISDINFPERRMALM